MEKIVIADLNDPFHSEAIVFLLNEYAKDEMGGGQELAEYTKLNLVSELKKRPHVFAIIVFCESEPAGLAICIEGFSSFASMSLLNVHDMVVLPKFRGRKYSQKLLAKAEEVAKERNCCKLTLEVLEGNTVAQNAYRAFGFQGYELDPKMGKALFWQKKFV
ncbi:MAG: GNAT family N-acetyltransferase [Limnobacter sp.]|uniref:GNAT family N-acetyltransferase n=1 Tax=Limnobacter sp. TaxID=2003368 RepID=UPI0022BC0C05|nr:GNAT family N-acetyltransferase [Limnobacter sp.]MCZ8014347.1 GNAT family N-acetyltransferase [Limnobacter sp.]